VEISHFLQEVFPKIICRTSANILVLVLRFITYIEGLAKPKPYEIRMKLELA
jgi:hypothetical protein